MMIPTTLVNPTFETPFDVQMSPELRRMDMVNQARRAELDAIVYGLNPRAVRRIERTSGAATNQNRSFRLLGGLRDGIGSVLIAAGQRIQSAA